MTRREEIKKTLFYILIVLIPVYFAVIGPAIFSDMLHDAQYESETLRLSILNLLYYGSFGGFLFVFTELYYSHGRRKNAQALFMIMTFLLIILWYLAIFQIKILSKWSLWAVIYPNMNLVTVIMVLYLLVSINSLRKSKELE